MDTHLADLQADNRNSLEFVELEVALELADIASGFDDAARSAAEATGGALLFTMPALGLPDCSRIAAVSLNGDGQRELVLVFLAADGRTTRIEKAAGSASPIAGLATSWATVMERMPAIAA